MSLGGGDQLARGAKSAQFGTGGKAMSQMEWDWTFMDGKKFKRTYGVTKKQYETARKIAEARIAVKKHKPRKTKCPAR